MSRRIFITGGTGFIGRALVQALCARGDEVVVLTRDRSRSVLPSGVELVEGDPVMGGAAPGNWQARLAGADVVVNLAGAPVAGQRWDARYKQLIRDSRVESTHHLVAAMVALPATERPRVLVSASGIDYYAGFRGGEPGDDDDITEQAPAGDGFLSRVCERWEQEARAAEAHGVRVVCMRTAVVLGRGGALDRMLTAFKLFAGGPLGSGRQWFSWIHLDDAVRAYRFAMDDERLSGPVNLTAPEPVRFADFARTLGRALHRPSWLPVPGFAIKAAVGEFGEYLLHGRRAVPAALSAHGFAFDHPRLDEALRDVLGA